MATYAKLLWPYVVLSLNLSLFDAVLILTVTEEKRKIIFHQNVKRLWSYRIYFFFDY